MNPCYLPPGRYEKSEMIIELTSYVALFQRHDIKQKIVIFGVSNAKS
jgi:hypothetical protein